jgi:hypothetical protein
MATPTPPSATIAADRNQARRGLMLRQSPRTDAPRIAEIINP